ncbi:MAG: S8 family serine peptidase, partial [Acidimicrobiia bacterium]
MKRMMVVLTVLSTALALAVPVGAVEKGTPPTGSASNHGYVLVTLPSPPAAAYEGGISGLARTRPERGHKLDLNSPAVAAYRRHLSAEQAAFIDELGRKAPGVEVVRRYSLVFNGLALKLNGHSINEVARVSGSSHLDYSSLYKPTMDVSPALIGADQVWPLLGGQADAGEGIKVGIIDSGIDTSNPFLDDSAYASADQIDQCPDQDLNPDTDNTNNKVIVCRVYASGVAPGAAGEHKALVVDHGTHVAGTVAGDPDTTGKVVVTPDDPDTTENEEVSVLIDGLSGVAPKAWLGNYNVFPGFGAGFVAFGGSAFSHDIIAALEDGVADGMDVLNMSLGGTVQGPHDPLAEAVNATVDAGLVVAVAAGNSGPGDATVESPGNAAGALTAGATTNPH